MLFAVVAVLSLATIAGFASEVSAQREPYVPLYLYVTLSTSNRNFRLATYLAAGELPMIFLPFWNSTSTAGVIAVYHYSITRVSEYLSHFGGGSVIPLFIVFDNSTARSVDGFVIGFQDGVTGYRNLAALESNNGSIDLYCENCIDKAISGKVIASWDTERDRWVSVIDTYPGSAFVVSSDLKVWVTKEFLPGVNSSVLESAVEVFPIADDDDASIMTWILVRKSDTQPSYLLYDTFVPDDANPQYREMGVLDGSTDCIEFAVLNDEIFDYRHRKVVGVKRAEYREFGAPVNTYLSLRELSFSGGILRQLPISTAFPTPTFKRLYPSMIFTSGDGVFSSFPPSVALAIEAEMKPDPSSLCGFDFFISEASREDFAIGLTIRPANNTITIERFNWFWAGPIVPNDTYSSLSLRFQPDGSGIYKILVVVDTCSVEYFLYDGMVVGSIFAFPKPDMNHHDIYTTAPLPISNLRVRQFD